MDHAFAWLEKNKLETEEEYPYTATGGIFRRCKKKTSLGGVSVKG